MNVFRLEIRNLYKSVLSWAAALSASIFLLLAFYPSMQTEAMQQLATTKLEGINPAVLQALGLQSMPDFTIMAVYFGYVLQYIVLAIMVFVTQKAVSLLVREESEGTIEYLYAQPVSRLAILLQKVCALGAGFVCLLLVTSLASVAGYVLYSDHSLGYSLREVGILFGGVFYIGLVFLAAGVLLSTLLPSERSSSAATIALVFGTFVLGIVGVVVEKLDFLRYFSPMDWIKAEKLLSDGIAPAEWVVGITVITLCISGAAFVYRRRDMRL